MVGHALALELVQTFLTARFSGEERHRRRLAKVTELEQTSGATSYAKDAGIPQWTEGEAMDAWRNEGDPN